MPISFGKKLAFALLLLFFILSSSVWAQESLKNNDWKNNWYVNTIWYQIFPDRFYNGDYTNDPTLSEKYDLEGNLLPLKITPWDDENPTYLSKYGGDLAGVGKKLDYLKDLGINGIWFNPVFKATSNHKYNTADYGMIDPEFGTRTELKTLLEQAHQKDIKVILDGVFNHTGYEFWAFQDVVKNGEESTYKNWFYINSFPILPLWKQSKTVPANYECWWGFGSLPKLNLDNPDTRGYIIDTCKGWIKTGIDGWRLDVPEEVKSKDFWDEWSAQMRKAKPDVYLSGEIWGEAKEYLQGNRFNGIMNYYGFREPVLRFFSAGKIKVSEFDRLLAQRRALYPHSVNCSLQNLLSSHDTVRIMTAIKNKDEKDGDKDNKKYDLSPIDPQTEKKLKMIVAFQMTYVGCPMIYYGDELGMPGGKDPDCRRPMYWDKIKQSQSLLDWHKKLIAIRNSHKSLRTGVFTTLLTDDKNKVYAYSRKEGNEILIVCMNYSPKRVKVSIPAVKNYSYIDLISQKTIISGNKLTLTLEPMELYILKKLEHNTI